MSRPHVYDAPRTCIMYPLPDPEALSYEISYCTPGPIDVRCCEGVKCGRVTVRWIAGSFKFGRAYLGGVRF